MSARPVYSRPTFDPARPTMVRRKFTAQGRRFEKGAEFPWRKLMITPRRARQMYDAGFLFHPGDDDRQAPEKSAAPDALAEAQHQSGGDLDDLDEIETLQELRDIAEIEGAQPARSKAEQRQRIRENRAASSPRAAGD